MMKNIFLIIICFFFSCKNENTEFIQSKVYKNLFLVKNVPNNDSLLKKDIKNFLIKNPDIKSKRKYYRVVFYKYSSSMSYFLENEEYDGFGAKVLSTHNNDQLGSFIISKCEKDSTKLVGELYFDGLRGLDNSLGEIDTLIYKCK